jgi:hypothetical protein
VPLQEVHREHMAWNQGVVELPDQCPKPASLLQPAKNTCHVVSYTDNKQIGRYITTKISQTTKNLTKPQTDHQSHFSALNLPNLNDGNNSVSTYSLH